MLTQYVTDPLHTSATSCNLGDGCSEGVLSEISELLKVQSKCLATAGLASMWSDVMGEGMGPKSVRQNSKGIVRSANWTIDMGKTNR